VLATYELRIGQVCGTVFITAIGDIVTLIEEWEAQAIAA
jgi:hypothetical protein